MPRVNVYLPKNLAAAVTAADLEVSTVCQSALREAVEAKIRGVTAQIDLLKTAVRLRRMTAEGHRDAGADDGRRWVRESATVKDLREISLVRITRDDPEHDDEEPNYEVSWADAPEETFGMSLSLSTFETLADWLDSHGPLPVDRSQQVPQVYANEYLLGFVEAAQAAWRDLRPLVEEGDMVLTRKIELLTEIERKLLTQTGEAATDEPTGEAAETG